MRASSARRPGSPASTSLSIVTVENGSDALPPALCNKASAAIDAEAHSKECDLVAFVTVSHKKGGGGFGMFKAIAPVLSSVAPVAGGAAGTGGYIAGSVAGSAISAASVSGQMKSKDELTLDVKVNRTGSTPVFEKVLKTKAKSNGEDIISQLVEQASQGIVDALAKQ